MSDFPYRTNSISDEEKLALFDQLKKLRLRKYVTSRFHYRTTTKLAKIFYTKDGRYQYLINDPNDYPITMLSDYFVDHCRVQCRFGSFISPYQYYQENKDKIVAYIESKGLEASHKNLREAVYEKHVECSIHNPLIIKYFIELYGAKTILDMSSGWGDRLIGSLAANVDKYVGTDPNSCLYEAYDEIIKLFRTKGTFYVNHAKFEEVDLQGQMFDLMYSSPPYFDYEIYTDKDGDHSLGDFSEDDWLKQFMYPSVMKIVQSLNNGGKAIFYFSQAKGRTYIEKWFDWMQSVPQLYYLGNMFYSDPTFRKNHPIFIYEKRQSIPKELYDPRLFVRQIGNLNVIEEDRLIGGTKSRVIVPYLKTVLQNNKIDEIIYAGASNGYAQVALAQALRLLKSHVKLSIYVQKTNLDDVKDLMILARTLYPVTYHELSTNLQDMLQQAETNASESAFLIPFGLADSLFKKLLQRSLKRALVPYASRIKRLWLTAGSGTILDVCYHLLPKTHFMVVQVGKTVDVSAYDRATLFVSSYRLYQPFKGKIPYPTTKSYDGKIWEFQEHFQPGDYIWNTAGIHSIVSH